MHLSLIKQQIVVTHTTRQTESPALLDSWDTNIPSVKTIYPPIFACPLIFVKT